MSDTGLISAQATVAAVNRSTSAAVPRIPCDVDGCDRAGTHWTLTAKRCVDHRVGGRRSWGSYSLDFSDDELRHPEPELERLDEEERHGVDWSDLELEEDE